MIKTVLLEYMNLPIKLLKGFPNFFIMLTFMLPAGYESLAFLSTFCTDAYEVKITKAFH